MGYGSIHRGNWFTAVVMLHCKYIYNTASVFLDFKSHILKWYFWFSHDFSIFQLKFFCDLLRIRWESTRSRTKGRALEMMDKLVWSVSLFFLNILLPKPFSFKLTRVAYRSIEDSKLSAASTLLDPKAFLLFLSC